jgi:hypothetical protein
MSTTIINGRVSRSQSYSYRLIAPKVGRFQIGKASINVGNKRYQTEIITLEVVKGKERKDPFTGNVMPGDEDLFLVAVMDTNLAYPGQQVYIDYKLYTTVNVRNYNTIKEDDYENFFFRYVKDFDKRPKQEVINGIQYTSQILKTIAIFPQQTGEFEIEEMILNVGVSVTDSRRTGFFFNTRTIPRTVQSNKLRLEVLPLPDNPPDSFTGAVGNFRLEAKANRSKITTDDALVLNVRIIGDGDARRWSPPSIGQESSFEIYEPSILEDNSVDQGGRLVNTKVIEYLMIPRTAGNKRFSVEFSYFDPDSTKYVTLFSRPIYTVVDQGQLTGGFGEQDMRMLQSDQSALRFLKTDLDLRKPKPAFFLSIPYIALISLPILLLGIVLTVKRKQIRFNALDPSEKKRLRARKQALKHLSEAHALIEDESDKHYYDAISRSIFGYVSHKLKIPSSAITKSNILQRMEESGIDPLMRKQAMDLILHCEQVLYAAAGSSHDRRTVYDQTTELIMNLEKQLG